ncbi:putative ATP-dependent RNA helicase [[Candida] railenensis]|uniref:ATP-dependent RNA helicase n=1 Tax=[Candida] railenensis TaxID=45579 RepID=A0A9P0QKX2_9ASCO|nr:putative ATP-dependent RNA helicase [[Candida] railenensis]
MAKKGKAKVETPPPPDPKDKKAKSKSKNATEEPKPDDPKKPQRGLAIGDNFGWTGKLPATLLFEYAQKQKWEKVVIDMRKNAKGFTGVVNLKWKNPKTQEMITVQMVPHSDTYQPRETTNEARHFAATYALFRINFVKNMKMVLPVIFRDYWSDLEASRLEMLKSNKSFHDILYNSQPFVVFLEQRELTEKREKEKLTKKQNEEKVKKPTVQISTIGTSSSSIISKIPNEPSKPVTSAAQKSDNVSDAPVKVSPKPPSSISVSKVTKMTNQLAGAVTKRIPTFPRKVWENAPFIDFTSEMRANIEDSIKKHINWTIQSSGKAIINSTAMHGYYNTLADFGFRESHILESFKYTNSFTDALEWLIFHIPEDDLPPYFMKSEKESGVSLKISKDIQMEYLIKRVSQSGADKDVVLTTLQENEFDEIKTIVKLTHKLINYEPEGPFEGENEETMEEDSLELWKQEIEAIDMTTKSNNIEFVDGSNSKIAHILLKPKRIGAGLLSLRLVKPVNYPQNIPGIQLIVNNTSFRLASYIKLSIVRQLVHFLENGGYVGSCYILSIIEWLEDNISEIIDNPGPLFDEELLGDKNLHNSTNTTKNSSKKKDKNYQKKTLKLTSEDIENLSSVYKKKIQSEEMIKSLSNRKKLPAWQKAKDLVSVINGNRVTIVTGETGSGKSTQIVQFILDDLNSKGNFSAKIMCTQPRRISTIGLAERISDERCDTLGRETGYIIRGENKTTSSTRISFVTTGVLLRVIQSILSNEDEMNDSMFENLEYIFIDEVHERSVDSDFLLIILRSIMSKFPKLKIILMSATININTFKDFFKTPLNHIHIEGRTFPIKDYYLDEILDELDYSMENNDGELIKVRSDSHFFKIGTLNYDLFAKLCLYVDAKLDEEGNDGSILIFLPGIMEINKCIRSIEDEFRKNSSKKDCWCLPLHSTLTSNEQKRVFLKSPNKQTRKIVVSTNVAETSITIPDCVVVIDSGRSKMMHFDSEINSTKLIENWCSKAEIGQRRGRSGRITNGNCYHLYTQGTVNSMLDQPIPEIKRTRLENLYLVVKSMGIDKVENFLNSGLDPPSQASLLKSRQFLIDIGALEEGGSDDTSISHLGKYLSLLPTDLQCGKLLILGCIFGCLETCLTIASISITGSPFKASFEERDNLKKVQNKFSIDQGDIIAMVRAYDEYIALKEARSGAGSSKKFLNENYLSFMTMKEITATRGQYINILQDIGFVPLKYNKTRDSTLNKNNDKDFIIRSIMTGAFYPQLARVQLPDRKFLQTSAGAVAVDPDARKTKFWIRNEVYMNSSGSTKDNSNEEDKEDELLPSSRAFIHPSSVLFSVPESEILNSINSEEYTNEDGSIDFAKAQQNYKIDFTPTVSNSKSSNSMIRAPFMVYNSSSHTSKLYLRDVTPTSTLAVLLFGGQIGFDLSNKFSERNTSPGIILDCVWPIRTWCKNGVLIKRLRHLLDEVIEKKLSQPQYSEASTHPSIEDTLKIVERILYI